MLGRFVKKVRKKNGYKIAAAILFAAVFIFAAGAPPPFAKATGGKFAFAQAPGQLGLEFATAIGLATTDVRVLVGNIIKGFLGLLGLVAVILILYGGWLWMTSKGEEDKIRAAKGVIVNAVIGLVIIASAYGIVAFIFRAILRGAGLEGPAAEAPGRTSFALSTKGAFLLDNGIIEYHYPEPGQTDVARNTRIAVTFKRPLALSTVFKNYDDRGTFDIADDRLCPGSPPCPGGEAVTADTALELNTANIKIIPNELLGQAGAGSADAQFNDRYPDTGALVSPAPRASVTPVKAALDPSERQTLIIRLASPIGSPTSNINYRAALRGGDNGIKVWNFSTAARSPFPVQENAFARAEPDGAYFWQFTTGTTIDITPPQIVAIEPVAISVPSNRPIDRNQLLQIYFNEPVDPTSVSGVLGPGGGFTKINITAGTETVAGTLSLGNRYRTAEFIPSARCEGVSENSCGEPVYCLPKNVDLEVLAGAASISGAGPQASQENGVVDMAGNSLDGNRNGTTEGPIGGTRTAEYNLNQPQTDLAAVSDSASWRYRVGDSIDLVPPAVTAILPVSAADPNSPTRDEAYPGGPSKAPSIDPVVVRWSKTMSVSSIKAGRESDAPEAATVTLESYECLKDPAATGCSCIVQDPPWFYIDAGSPVDDGTGKMVTKMAIRHRAFYQANQLGFTDADLANCSNFIPRYVPGLRAQLMDTKQNCFSPSVGYACPQNAMTQRDAAGRLTQPSCCERTEQGTYSCTP